MYAKLLHLKRRWKPPYEVAKFILLLVLVSICAGTRAQSSKEEQFDDDFEIITESTWNSLTFSLNDTEKYEVQSAICERKTVEETDIPCDKLLPCTSYEVTLKIKNRKDETQEPIERRISAITDYGEPSVEIIGAAAGIETVFLTWSATNRTCINTFQIDIKSLEKEYTYKKENEISELLIDNLNPCREQHITFATYDIKKTLVSTLAINTTTLYAEPGNVNITIEPYDDAQVRVSWKDPQYSTCIEYYYFKWYTFECGSSGGTESITNTTTTTVTSFTDTINRVSDSIRIASDIATTDDDDTNTMTMTTAAWSTTGDGNSMDITSIPPTVPDADDVVCEWSAKVKTLKFPQYVIGNLQGCELYGFEMYINSETVPNAEPQHFTAPEQVPGIVTVEKPLTHATDLTAYWNEPKLNFKCVSEYQVVLIGPLQRAAGLQKSHTGKTSKTEFFFDSLDPCGEYNLSIIAISLNGSAGAAFNSTIQTMESTPSAIVEATFVAEPEALNISWSPPVFGDLCLKEYRLTGWIDGSSSNQNFDKDTTEHFARIEGLYPCQSYMVQIIPVTVENNDGEPTLLPVETAAKVSMASNLQAVSTYPNALELNAIDGDFNNKCEIIMARFVCEETKATNAIYKTAEQYVDTLDRVVFRAMLQPLSPYTSYRCSIALFNTAGWSPNVTFITSTLPYYPDQPEKLTLTDATNVSLAFGWQQPKFLNGVLKWYVYYFQRVAAAYYVPPQCTPIHMEAVSRETTTLYVPAITKLLPYTTYSFQVAAQNEYGVGDYTLPFLATTQPWISEPVTQLRTTPEGPYDSELEYQANVLVSWLMPCQSNGEIELFVVDFLGERIDHEPQSFQRLVNPKYDDSGRVTHNETDLKPEYTYSVSVAVRTRGVEPLSKSMQNGFMSPAGIPQKLGDAGAGKVWVNAFASSNPTRSAVVRFPVEMLRTETGTIWYAALLVSEKNCNPEPQMRYGALNVRDSWPNVRTWSEAFQNGADCVRQYQATEVRWQPLTSLGENTSQVVYIIGTEQCSGAESAECEDPADCGSAEKVYCNGPLKPDTEYHLVLRLFTRSGYNDVALLEFRTDALFQLTVIIISVCSCLLLALIAGSIYIWVTKRMLWQRESCHGIEDAFGDVLAKNFAIYYREVSKPEKIAREFKELTLVAMDLSYAASELGSNKNRYADIFPYDKNRVILDIDAEGSDYINGSFIDGYKRKKEYIATQGPKPESAMDFWRMVLQHEVRVIVMVTQFREGNEIKCHEYFPFKSKGINVIVKKKDSFEIYDRTEMSVMHEKHGMRRKVVHYYYKKWPDHGCPADPAHLITFVRKVKAERVPSYSPIVVHCSAGVGRTGTFIGLDIIMQRLKYESKINIFETVKKLRFQRMKMVQTMAQYTLLYTCVYELVKHKYARVNMKKALEDVDGSNSNGKSFPNNNNNHNSGKRSVSFQDDPELNIIGTVPAKLSSGLSSVDEREADDANIELGLPAPQWDEEAIGYGTRPIRYAKRHKFGELYAPASRTLAAKANGNVSGKGNGSLTLGESHTESAM